MMEAASLQLERSRAMLRASLQTHLNSQDSSKKSSHKSGKNDTALIFQWFDHLPGAKIWIPAAQYWWSKHPLHTAASQITKASAAAIGPVAQRHPVQLVFLAALAGAGLVWCRPWRWIAKPALFATIAGQLTSAIIAQLSDTKSDLTNKP